jgi:hypothetical protein
MTFALYSCYGAMSSEKDPFYLYMILNIKLFCVILLDPQNSEFLP